MNKFYHKYQLKIVNLIILILLLTVYSHIAAAKGLYGIRISGSTVVFLMDVSPSMEGTHEEVLWKRETTGVVDDIAKTGANEVDVATGTPTGSLVYDWLNRSAKERSSKLAKAKKELSKAIKGMNTETKFNVALFSENVEFWSGKPELADKGNKEDAKEFIEYATTSEYTNIGMALEAAFEVEGVDEIFLITDGEPTDKSPQDILKQVSQVNQNRNVRINTVGLGEIPDDSFLKNLAVENSGRYARKKK